MEHLVKALAAGKQRGYDEVRLIDSINYLFQYAIKKEKEVYLTYFLKIDESKFDAFEDYAEEEILTFQTFEDALQYLNKQGADFQKMSAKKATLPF
jgi:hypothetical protein